jgi:hypothetical protein
MIREKILGSAQAAQLVVPFNFSFSNFIYLKENFFESVQPKELLYLLLYKKGRSLDHGHNNPFPPQGLSILWPTLICMLGIASILH